MATKAASAVQSATMTPPIAGPRLRARLKLMLLSAIAGASASGGTCSVTEACQAGPNSAIEQPIRKQKISSSQGVTRPSA